MAKAEKWTLIVKTINDHIVVPKTATVDNIARVLNNANPNWTSIAKVVNKYEIKNGTHNSITQRILDIKNEKIINLNQISGTTEQASSTASSEESSDTGASAESTPSGLNSTVSRIPITDPEEALEFAKTEWNKIRRTSGHELECQVFGSHHWQVGDWCKVYLPTLNEYTDMYITKVNNSNDSGSEWLTNLTLMDYAPSLSTLDEDKVKETGNNAEGTDTGTGTGTEEATSKWTDVAAILQEYFEKPDDGWDSHIRAIINAKVYDPDIKEAINTCTRKDEYKLKSYIDIGRELQKTLGMGY